MQIQASDYWKLFKPSACSLKLKATGQDEVFEELVANFVRAKLLPAELEAAAVQAFKDRETLASTGVGNNVAIPHVKLKGITEPLFSLALVPDGLEWKSVDGEPVKIFFAVLRPESANDQFDPERHLEMMRWISGLVREADFRRFALAVTKRSELVDLLKEMSRQ